MARRILVGYDGSPASGEALAHAVGLARADHAALVVVLVLPWRCLAPGPMTALAAQLVEDCEEEQRRALRRAIDELPPDISVTFLERHGSVCETLRRTAAEHRCDLIVVCGRRRARRLWRRAASAVVVAPDATAPAPRRDRRAVTPPSAPAPATPP